VINTRTAVQKPHTLTHVEAASIPLCGLTAINGLRECAAIKAGDRVLIVGASGGVGTLAIQIAKNWGAHVTAVCSNRNMELAVSLGADVVIDYTAEDPLVADIPYDIIYDTVGVHTHDTARAALTPEGTYLTLVPVAGVDFYIPGQTQRESGKGYFVAWIPTAADLQILSDWANDDRLHAVIDSVYSLDDVRAAHERSQTERAVGKIMLQVRD
jgi:NADPH:quinone reductase-like Zn-dependent oxidoreductase